MIVPATPSLAAVFAARVRDRSEAVTHAWLGRVVGRADSSDQPALPFKHLLDAAPAVVGWIADHIAEIETDLRSVRPLLQDVAELQHSRGRRASEVVRDIELLTEVLFDLLRGLARESPDDATLDAVAELGQRIHCSLSAMAVAVIDIYENANRNELRDARSRLEDFVRTLGHEMKNPLGAAELALTMLTDDEVVSTAEEKGRYVEMIGRNLERSLKLLNELGERALPVLGASDSMRWTSLRSLVDEVLSEVAPTAEESQVTIRIDELPGAAEVPSRAAKLVMMNLVWNALKYADREKEDRWIRISVRDPDPEDVWFVDVEDNGIGIPQEMRQQIFERFFRADPDLAEGTGLGLSIAREAAEEAGGGLWFRSEVGVGSTFTAAFPVRNPGHVDMENLPEPAKAEGRGNDSFLDLQSSAEAAS